MRRLLFALILLVCSPGWGAIYTWQLEGVVENSGGFAVPGVGTEVSFVINFDTSAADGCPQAETGFYSLPTASLAVGGYSFHSGQTFYEANSFASCAAPFGGFNYRLLFLTSDAGPTPYNFSAAVLFWTLPSGDMPIAPPSQVVFAICQSGLCNGAISTGDITRATELPAPSTLLLTSVGFLALLRRRR